MAVCRIRKGQRICKRIELYTGDAAQVLLSGYQKQAKKLQKKAKTAYTGIEGNSILAKETVPANENQAFTHVRATVNQTLATKKICTGRCIKVGWNCSNPGRGKWTVTCDRNHVPG